MGITIGSIFGPFIGVTLSLLALQHIYAGVSTAISSITPVTIIPFSILVLKEKVKLKEILGAIVTIIGVIILFI